MPERSSSEGVGGRLRRECNCECECECGFGNMFGFTVEVLENEGRGSERARKVLSGTLSNNTGGSRSFSISDRRASSKLMIAFLMPSAPRASVP